MKSKRFYTVFNPVQKKPSGELQQKGTDTSIFRNVNELAGINSYDKAILVSGDGDFVPLIDSLKEKQKKIEVWSFKISLSKDLKAAVGIANVHYLDDIFDKIIFQHIGRDDKRLHYQKTI